MAELDDLKASVANLGTQAGAAETALTDISAKLTALSGTTPAPGVLEDLATQINTIAAGLGAAATAAEPPATPPAS